MTESDFSAPGCANLEATNGAENEMRRYVVIVDGEEPAECDERALMMAWARVPGDVFRVRQLQVGDEVDVLGDPNIVVRRLA